MSGAPGAPIDPARNFNFVVEVGKDAYGIFTECSGLEGTTEVIEHRQGGSRKVTKLPGRTTFSDITLKWGVTTRPELWTWRARIMAGEKPTPKLSGSIVVFDLDNSTEVARWNFSEGWPTKYIGPAFDARANEIAVETVVLAVEWLERA
jgi:phage tail-like protein